MELEHAIITLRASRDVTSYIARTSKVDSTPPDHLNCVLRLVVEEAASQYRLTACTLPVELRRAWILKLGSGGLLIGGCVEFEVCQGSLGVYASRGELQVIRPYKALQGPYKAL